MTGLVWKTPPSVLSENIMKYADDVVAAAVAEITAVAANAQKWMKSNAGWQDITGEARGKLSVKVEQASDRIMVYFIHGAPHGIYLELSNGGKYAIISTAQQKYGPEIMAALKAMLG